MGIAFKTFPYCPLSALISLMLPFQIHDLLLFKYHCYIHLYIDVCICICKYNLLNPFSVTRVSMCLGLGILLRRCVPREDRFHVSQKMLIICTSPSVVGLCEVSLICVGMPTGVFIMQVLFE